MKTYHVVCGDASLGYVMRCEHCGAAYAPALPVDVSMYLAMLRRWIEMHEGCPSPRPGDAKEERNG